MSHHVARRSACGSRDTNHGLYTSSTASQRNEVMAAVSRASAVRWGEMQAGLPRPRRVRPVEKSRTGCAGATGGRPSAQAQGGRVFLANQVPEWPFGSPWVRKGRATNNRRPDRCARQVNASLLTSAHYCPELPSFFLLLACSRLRGIARQKNIAPEQMSAHRQPFSVGLTTNAR